MERSRKTKHTMQRHAVTTEEGAAGQRCGTMRHYFEAMDHSVLAARGRIVFEQNAPYFIISCDGGSARILGTSSSHLAGRRLRAIAQNGSDIAKIERASHASSNPHTRSYFSIVTATGLVPVIVQRCRESCTGRLQLEALLFPASECLSELVQDLHIEDLSILPMHKTDDFSGRDSPDKEIGLDADQDADNDALTGLANDLLGDIGERMRMFTLKDGTDVTSKHDVCAADHDAD